MAITNLTRQQFAGTTWLIKATSDLDDPLYRWYIDGVLVETTNRDYLYYDTAGAPVQVEVRDDDTAAQPAYPSRLLLNWRPVATATAYRIEEYVDDAWAYRALVRDTGQSYFRYWTSELADGDEHRWRVVPINTADIDGAEREFRVTLIRRPAAPIVEVALNEDLTFTISEAS